MDAKKAEKTTQPKMSSSEREKLDALFLATMVRLMRPSNVHSPVRVIVAGQPQVVN